MKSRLRAALKWMYIAVAPVAALALLLVAFVTYDVLTTKEEKLAEIFSPDGSYEVWTVLQKGIIDTETTVMVRDVAEAARLGSRSWHAVATFDGMMREADLRVSWQDQRTLIVEYYPYIKSDSFHVAETQFKDLKVVMQKMQVTPTPR